MNWREIYRQKFTTMEDAARAVQSGDVVFAGAVVCIPFKLVDAVVDRASELRNVKIITMLPMKPTKLASTPGLDGKINHSTLFYGGADKVIFKNNITEIASVQFMKIEYAMRYVHKIDTLMVPVSPPDENGYMDLGPTGISWSSMAVDYAKKIICSVNPKMYTTCGTKNKIHVSQVHCLCECEEDLPEYIQPEVSEIDQTIANYLLEHIKDGACIQLGLGGLSNAVGYGLAARKNLTIYSEMFTDSMLALIEQGNGIVNGIVNASFALGSRQVYEFCKTGRVQLAPISLINDVNTIASRDNFISINACLMSDLTGQVCSESLGFTPFSSVGGQLDFVRGASLSKGGKSFLCLPSTATAKDGSVISRITLSLPPGAVVTTPRTDVMYIATEYGIADLYCRSVEERVRAMIKISHPQFREQLKEEAKAVNLIR